MSKQLHILSDRQLKAWVAAAEPVAKSDGGNLTFTLSKAGKASWILRYYNDAGKRQEVTLGNYPDISLAEARKIASQMRADRAKGIDPGKEKAARKQQARVKEWTVAMLAEDYRVKNLQPEQFAPATLYYRNSDLDRVIIPRLGKRTVTSITGPDVVQMIRDQGDTWTISKRVLTTITKLFDHAAGMRLVDINPCIGIRLPALLGPRPAIKKRVMLSEADLRLLFTQVDKLGTLNSLNLRILLATCVRTNELTQARWKDVDLENGTWFVHDENTKTRAGFHVPLAPPVIEWFKELKRYAGDSEYVLPARIARTKSRPTIDPRTLWAVMDRAFDDKRLTVTRFTPHDTRSTAKGHMLDMGIPDHVTELALSHALKGMQAIYDVRKEIPEKRDALNKWAAYLVSLMPNAEVDGAQTPS
jgi:integrase